MFSQSVVPALENIDCKDLITRPPMAPRLPLKWIGGSARPLAARLAGYLSLASIR